MKSNTSQNRGGIGHKPAGGFKKTDGQRYTGNLKGTLPVSLGKANHGMASLGKTRSKGGGRMKGRSK